MPKWFILCHCRCNTPGVAPYWDCISHFVLNFTLACIDWSFSFFFLNYSPQIKNISMDHISSIAYSERTGSVNFKIGRVTVKNYLLPLHFIHFQNYRDLLLILAWKITANLRLKIPNNMYIS